MTAIQQANFEQLLVLFSTMLTDRDREDFARQWFAFIQKIVSNQEQQALTRQLFQRSMDTLDLLINGLDELASADREALMPLIGQLLSAAEKHTPVPVRMAA